MRHGLQESKHYKLVQNQTFLLKSWSLMVARPECQHAMVVLVSVHLVRDVLVSSHNTGG